MGPTRESQNAPLTNREDTPLPDPHLQHPRDPIRHGPIRATLSPRFFPLKSLLLRLPLGFCHHKCRPRLLQCALSSSLCCFHLGVLVSILAWFSLPTWTPLQLPASSITQRTPCKGGLTSCSIRVNPPLRRLSCWGRGAGTSAGEARGAPGQSWRGRWEGKLRDLKICSAWPSRAQVPRPESTALVSGQWAAHLFAAVAPERILKTTPSTFQVDT